MEHKKRPERKDAGPSVLTGIVQIVDTFAAAVLRHRNLGPLTFLSVSSLVAISMILSSMYTPSLAVSVNGEQLGIVADRSTIDQVVQKVEEQAVSYLGYEIPVTEGMDYEYGVILKADLTGDENIQDYFQEQLDVIKEKVRQCEVLVDGQHVAIIKDENAIQDVLEEIKAQYVNENTTSCDFAQEVTVQYVYGEDNPVTANQLREILESDTAGQITYTAQEGDSLNRIANANGMTIDELLALNPGRTIDDMLWVGDVLNVRESKPVLSVITHEHQVSSKEIPVTVETQDDASMYKGESKILSEGTPGEIQVDSDVTLVNGVEQERTVTSETTIREATPTIKAVGTKEKPTTASTGKLSWPIRGRINSGFGGRYIFGSYSIHKGIDIDASYGATIKAADGGVVTCAGYNGSLGNCVIIKHDNGMQTYYGHNSSVLVSVGQRVAKGQAIAKAGSTGVSTGVHCHFGVMVNGTFVNPLQYL